MRQATVLGARLVRQNIHALTEVLATPVPWSKDLRSDSLVQDGLHARPTAIESASWARRKHAR